MAVDWADLSYEQVLANYRDALQKALNVEAPMSRYMRGGRAWGQAGSLEGQRKLTQTPPRSAFTTPSTEPVYTSIALPIEGEGCEIVVEGLEDGAVLVVGKRKDLWGSWAWIKDSLYANVPWTNQAQYYEPVVTFTNQADEVVGYTTGANTMGGGTWTTER